jgi:hypothetical protein
MSLVIELDEPTCRIATERNVVIARWLDAPTLTQIQAVGRVGRARRAKYQDGIVLVNLIVSGKANFTQDVRDEIGRLFQANHFTIGACHVVLVPGLAGVATRAFLATVSLIARAKNPSRVVSTVDAAAEWVVERTKANGAERWHHTQVLDVFGELMPGATETPGRSAGARDRVP